MKRLFQRPEIRLLAALLVVAVVLGFTVHEFFLIVAQLLAMIAFIGIMMAVLRERRSQFNRTSRP